MVIIRCFDFRTSSAWSDSQVFLHFTAEGLKSFLVTNQQEIEQKIEEGTTNRSIAATNMNETSSRAHTIVGIEIIQKVLSTEKFSINECYSLNIIHAMSLI